MGAIVTFLPGRFASVSAFRTPAVSLRSRVSGVWPAFWRRRERSATFR